MQERKKEIALDIPRQHHWVPLELILQIIDQAHFPLEPVHLPCSKPKRHYWHKPKNNERHRCPETGSAFGLAVPMGA